MKQTKIDRSKPDNTDEFSRLLKAGILRQLYIEKKVERTVYDKLSAVSLWNHKPEKMCK